MDRETPFLFIYDAQTVTTEFLKYQWYPFHTDETILCTLVTAYLLNNRHLVVFCPVFVLMKNRRQL